MFMDYWSVDKTSGKLEKNLRKVKLSIHIVG